MAELHIEREHRTIWPWILAAILLLLLAAWFFVWRGADTGAVAVGDSTATEFVAEGAATAPLVGDAAGAGLSAESRAFVTYVEERRARSAADQTHEYTADGLRRLGDALGAIAAGDPAIAGDLQPRLDSLRVRADRMQREPTSTAHAEQARQAFLAAAIAMQTLQERAFPSAVSEVAEVRRAASAVVGDRLLLDQTADVQRFFDSAAAALQAMAASPTT